MNAARPSRSPRPSASAVPSTPAGGASEAATSIPTAAPDTRLLCSEETRYSAPAAPAASGSSTCTIDRSVTVTISPVAERWPTTSARRAAAAAPVVTPAAYRPTLCRSKPVRPVADAIAVLIAGPANGAISIAAVSR